jgi:hypothetical protein
MMRRTLAIIVLLVATRAFCFGDSYSDVSFIESHWQTFSNISSFHEFYSITNLPLEVRSNLVYVYNAHTASGLEDPGMPLMTNGYNLIWAATDGTNYVAYWHVAFNSTLQDMCEAEGWSDCCITAAIREAGSTNLIVSTGRCYYLFDPLKDYKALIDYEMAEGKWFDFPQ